MNSNFNLLFYIANLYFISSYLYRDYSYIEINHYLESIKGNFANISTAIDLYGIKKASFNLVSCSPYLARITDLNTLSNDYLRPQLLISGEIHGDERVGPGSSLVLSQLLVWSAECLILNVTNSCIELDKYDDLTTTQKIWLAHLATRRDTYIIPTANCLGYINRVRNDALVDPNRDFPYKRNDNQCMRSTTAKIFQSVMASNIIQIVVTFHGGMVAIGYEWGSENHIKPKDTCPDDVAHSDIAWKMKLFAGRFSNEKLYPVGRINSIIYPVYGGMEDWLYAAGWDTQQLSDCKDNLIETYNNNNNNNNRMNSQSIVQNNLRGNTKYIPLNKKTFNMNNRNNNQRILKSNPKIPDISENRALVFLIETSDKKSPSFRTLGGSSHILHSINGVENGHIPRNIRLSLFAIDMVQPYVCINSLHLMNHQDRVDKDRVSNYYSASRQITIVRTTNEIVQNITKNTLNLTYLSHNNIIDHGNIATTNKNTTTTTADKNTTTNNNNNTKNKNTTTTDSNNANISNNNNTATSYLDNQQQQRVNSTMKQVNDTNIINDTSTINSNHRYLKDDTIFSNDITSSKDSYNDNINNNNNMIRKLNESIKIEWYIGGASTVDCTFLAWHRSEKLISIMKHRKKSKHLTRDWTNYMSALYSMELSKLFNNICDNYKDKDIIPYYSYSDTTTTTSASMEDLSKFPIIIASPIYSGLSRWSSTENQTATSSSNSSTSSNQKYIPSELQSSAQYDTMDPMKPKSSFIASNVKPTYQIRQDPSLDTTTTTTTTTNSNSKAATKSLPAGKYWLIAWTMVDQGYAKANQGYPSNIPAQSHLVNIRTNSNWYRKVNTRISKGRLFWPSDPVEVVVLSSGDYYLKSVCYHCAWWDIKELSNNQSQDQDNIDNLSNTHYIDGNNTNNHHEINIEGNNSSNNIGFNNYWNNISNQEISLRYILEHSVQLLPNADQLHSAQTLYAITCALLVLTIIVCGIYMCSQQWKHRNRIYSSLVKNKYANFSNFSRVYTRK